MGKLIMLTGLSISNKFDINEKEWEIRKEYQTSFHVYGVFGISDKYVTKRVMKNWILSARENRLLDQPGLISRVVWCFPEDKEKAEKILRDEIRKVANKIRMLIDDQMSYL